VNVNDLYTLSVQKHLTPFAVGGRLCGGLRQAGSKMQIRVCAAAAREKDSRGCSGYLLQEISAGRHDRMGYLYTAGCILGSSAGFRLWG